MKKVIFAALVMIMMLAMATSAMAVTFSLSVPCVAIDDSQLYQYHYTQYDVERGGDNKIFVSHHVTQTSNVETNRIAAYRRETQMTMGANWHRADNGLYQCMSAAIVNDDHYTVAGRGNTNYTSKYGLDSVTMSGFFRAALD